MKTARLFVGALIVAGCQTLGLADKPAPNSVKFEVFWVGQDHRLQDCARGLEKSYDLADGTLFYTRQSKIQVKVPAGKENYHLHLIHRVAGEHRMDEVVRSADAKSGIISLSLESYSAPELLILTSSSYTASEKESPYDVPEKALIPPFMVAYRLEQAETLESLVAGQNFRYDIRTPMGKLAYMVQPLNRGDMILTMIDPTAKHGRLFEDVFVYSRKDEAAVLPKLEVEVLHDDGTIWQRTGVWPRPVNGDLALRTPSDEVLTFSAPASVKLRPLTDKPGVMTQITAVLDGAQDGETFRVVLADAFPVDRKTGRHTYRVQAVDLTAQSPTRSIPIDYSNTDSMNFPLTSALVNRVVAPWQVPGGFFNPRPPRGVGQVSPSAKLPTMPKLVSFAGAASHYDLLTFSGGPGKVAQGRLLAALYASGSSSPLSPTLNPGSGSSTDNPNNGNTTVVQPPQPGPLLGSTSTNSGTNPNNLPILGWSQNRDDGPAKERVGEFTIKFKCGCSSPSGCKCTTHGWSMNGCMNGICKTFPGAADVSWFGYHGGRADCHAKTLVGIVRVSWWDGPGYRLRYDWYKVYVTFLPCEVSIPPPPPPIPPPPPPPGDPDKKDDPKLAGGDPEGGIEVIDLRGFTDVPTSVSHQPFNDPQLVVAMQHLVSTSPELGARAGSAVLVSPWLLNADVLNSTRTVDATSAAYWKRLAAMRVLQDGREQDPLSWDAAIFGAGSTKTTVEAAPPVHEPVLEPEPIRETHK